MQPVSSSDVLDVNGIREHPILICERMKQIDNKRSPGAKKNSKKAVEFHENWKYVPSGSTIWMIC